MNETDDIKYATLWSVFPAADGSVEAAELYCVMDFRSKELLSNYSPSEKFMKEAEKQIRQMKWDFLQDENGKVREQAACCYVLGSNPDEPRCSNNLTP